MVKFIRSQTPAQMKMRKLLLQYYKKKIKITILKSRTQFKKKRAFGSPKNNSPCSFREIKIKISQSEVALCNNFAMNFMKRAKVYIPKHEIQICDNAIKKKYMDQLKKKKLTITIGRNAYKFDRFKFLFHKYGITQKQIEIHCTEQKIGEVEFFSRLHKLYQTLIKYKGNADELIEKCLKTGYNLKVLIKMLELAVKSAVRVHQRVKINIEQLDTSKWLPEKEDENMSSNSDGQHERPPEEEKRNIASQNGCKSIFETQGNLEERPAESSLLQDDVPAVEAVREDISASFDVPDDVPDIGIPEDIQAAKSIAENIPADAVMQEDIPDAIVMKDDLPARPVVPVPDNNPAGTSTVPADDDDDITYIGTVARVIPITEKEIRKLQQTVSLDLQKVIKKEAMDVLEGKKTDAEDSDQMKKSGKQQVGTKSIPQREEEKLKEKEDDDGDIPMQVETKSIPQREEEKLKEKEEDDGDVPMLAEGENKPHDDKDDEVKSDTEKKKKKKKKHEETEKKEKYNKDDDDDDDRSQKDIEIIDLTADSD